MKLSDMMAGLDATLVRDGDVRNFGSLASKRDFTLHYFADPRFRSHLDALTGSRSVVTTPQLASTIPDGFGLALGRNPKETFLRAYLRHGRQLMAPPPFPSEIDPTAQVHPRASVAAQSVRIGARTVIDANAVIQERVTLEEDVWIGAGSVVGGTGFEVGMVDGHQIVVPHYSGVVIRRGAVLMANVGVSCGIFGDDTEIGEETILDNLVHVAHNVKIGARCQIMAAAMLSGSCLVEDEVRIGPNATISNALRIGRGARITLGAVVTRDVPPGGHVTGHFAIPHERFLEVLRGNR